MSWFEMMDVIKELLGKKPPPDFLLLHAGGNDLINVPTVELCAKIAKDIDELHTLLPGCSIIWSDILTRLKYRGCENIQAIEKKRKRVNREGRKAAFRHRRQGSSAYRHSAHMSGIIP
ncbi:hypothetical protein KP79_PYT00828 [Mizuhopecten yessoensis]|uniref:SGNH hydrolase-type esterase domain-containing protein n=1 Tax=Mizuhopecten yessoensis TaxID=6573 RepID=A0A210QPY5_MIZYE|nr:hypothetical protein KP79_PYT00828 [Mizuhopecten yessoensis]